MRGNTPVAELYLIPMGGRLGDFPMLMESLSRLLIEEARTFGDDLDIAKREIGISTARAHAQIWAELASCGNVIYSHDLWLAATCIAHGFTVITNHVRDSRDWISSHGPPIAPNKRNGGADQQRGAFMEDFAPVMRLATASDASILEEIREVAFAPVFSSFRSILGDELYRLVQAHEDEQQAELLAGLFADDSDWDVYVAEVNAEIVGFVSIRLAEDTRVGEIGLNAVNPAYSGRGIGTAMYEYVLKQMKEAGMRAATVATGGDSSHAPARRAYEKVGFDAHIPSIWMCKRL